MYFRCVNYMSIKPGERERRPASRGKQGLEGQGSLRSGKEGGLGEKLGEVAVCSISCSRLVQGVKPGCSLGFVSPGSLVTWSTLVGDPALWVDGPFWQWRSQEECVILWDLDILALDGDFSTSGSSKPPTSDLWRLAAPDFGWRLGRNEGRKMLQLLFLKERDPQSTAHPEVSHLSFSHKRAPESAGSPGGREGVKGRLGYGGPPSSQH